MDRCAKALAMTATQRSDVRAVDRTPAPNPKYAFIDALRGYAVLLVITTHVGDRFPELPYPLKKLTNYGWHGVQLFFLMSCVTLMLSWRADEAKGRTSVTAFWTRRVFRIAPLYYLAAALYFVAEPPASGFDLGQLLATMGFVNAWHPALIPTIGGRWAVVPGGWSIGVEFTFYALFPLLAMQVKSMRTAILICAAAALIGCVLNPYAYSALAGIYGHTATKNFLYYWFPNQAPVFMLGLVLFYALLAIWNNPQGRAATMFRAHANAFVLASGALLAVAANLPIPNQLPFALPFIVPAPYVASALFMVIACALGSAPNRLFVNKAVCSYGTVSFSAYVLHFLVLHKLPVLFPAVFDVQHVTGWTAILTFALLWAAVVPLTYALSRLTYASVEQPMIALGRRLLAARRRPAPASAAIDV